MTEKKLTISLKEGQGHSEKSNTEKPKVIESTNQTSSIFRITSSIRTFFEDWKQRKKLAESIEPIYKPQHAYRDIPELTIDNLSTEALNRKGLERVSIDSNIALHQLFVDFLSVLDLKIGNATSYGLSDKYRKITGHQLAFDFTSLRPVLVDLVSSEYFLTDHSYLLEINQDRSQTKDSLNPESLLGSLVAVADRKAGKYLFKPQVPSSRYLSKMDLYTELLPENTEFATARAGFNPAVYRLGVLPLASILANPLQFSTNKPNLWLVELFVANQQNDHSFLASVSGGIIQLFENCYFGNRRHDISGRSRCSKNHHIGQTRLLVEKRR